MQKSTLLISDKHRAPRRLRPLRHTPQPAPPLPRPRRVVALTLVSAPRSFPEPPPAHSHAHISRSLLPLLSPAPPSGAPDSCLKFHSCLRFVLLLSGKELKGMETWGFLDKYRCMTTIRRFCCDDLLRFAALNLDHITETFNMSFYMTYMARWPDLFHEPLMCLRSEQAEVSSSDQDVRGESRMRPTGDGAGGEGSDRD